MHPVSRWLAIPLFAAATLWPAAAAAQTQASSYMTVQQVRGAFDSAGFQVDQPLNWDWLRPPVTSFQVHSRNDSRVLMVLVYDSTDSADAARMLAESHEQALNSGEPVTTAAGPHLVAGFGTSVWNGNVALVETTQAQLDNLYQAELERDMDIGVVNEPPPVDVAVDMDFQQALNAGAVNL
jgi:hypothetical protein